MDFASFFRGARALRPVTPESDSKKDQEPAALEKAPEPLAPPVHAPTEIQKILQEMHVDLGQHAHPEVVAAYIQARSTLVLAQEVGKLRDMLQSGEAALTVAVENQHGR